MALINSISSDQSTAGKQARSKAATQQIVTNTYTQIQAALLQLWRLAWNNPEGLAPADYFAGLGTDAASLLALATIAGTTLTQASQIAGGGQVTPSLPAVPSSYTITPNADGTVTLAIVPPAPP